MRLIMVEQILDNGENKACKELAHRHRFHCGKLQKVTHEPQKNKIIEMTDTDISKCHKNNSKNLECTRTERQNVGLAAGEKKLVKNTGDFIELVSNWFDLMNSFTPNQNLCTKNPNCQKEILYKMKETALNMRSIRTFSSHIFQKGIHHWNNFMKSFKQIMLSVT